MQNYALLYRLKGFTKSLCIVQKIKLGITFCHLIFVILIRSGFVMADEEERTSVPHVFGVGDILEGRPELTPVAVQAGRLLARRLFANASLKVCTFTSSISRALPSISS